jgi:hypothetical protein
LVRVHTFEVSEDYATIERVPMLRASVVDHRISHGRFVIAHELAAAPGTRLSECHTSHGTSERQRHACALVVAFGDTVLRIVAGGRR